MQAMPQSLSSILIHVVFSTKDRAPVLDDSIRPSLYAYMATTLKKLGCNCYRIGGVEDHVHLAVELSRTITVAELVEKIKSGSSKWLKQQRPILHNFSWQRGYGVFSFSNSDLNQILLYIENQEAHHKQITFQDELRLFLKKHGSDWDERYVWD